MNIENIINNQYVDWKVKPVMIIKNKYGFRIILTMIDGTQITQQKSGFETKRKANIERNNTIAALTTGTYILNSKIKLDVFLEFWLEKVMKPKITNNTYVTYLNSITKYIIPKMGNLYLTNIDRGHIANLYKHIFSLTKTGVGIARTVLKTSFKYAMTKKLMIINPVLKTKLPKGIKLKPYRTVNIDSAKTLTLEQVNILLSASIGTKIHLQVLFAVLMGLRRCEINGLKYSDIDYIRRTIKVQRQLGIKPNTKKEDFAPKTFTKQEIELKTFFSYRELDIPDYLFEEILNERKKYEENRNRRKNDKSNPFQDLDYICCSASGRPRSKSYVSPHFKELLKNNNLPDIRWHDLRATFATILLKNNYSCKAVSSLMGHAKEIITVDIYGDNQKIIEDCLEDLEPFIEEVIPHKEMYNDYTNDYEYVSIIDEFYSEIKEEIIGMKFTTPINDFTKDDEYIDVIEDYLMELNFVSLV